MVSAEIGTLIYTGEHQTEDITARHYESADNVVIIGEDGTSRSRGRGI
jgi:hypothetical protein